MKNLYNSAEIYDIAHTKQMEQAMKEQWKKLLKDKDINTILDCSIGSGNLTLSLLELGYQVTGSDLNEQMLDRCKQKAQKRGKQILLKQCDFRKLTDCFKEPFDCVLSTGNSLPHVSNKDFFTALSQMDKLCKPEGYLYFDLRNWDKILDTHQRFYFYPPLYQDDIRVNFMQVWDYNLDKTITFHLLYSFEKESRILGREVFEELYYPISYPLIMDYLKELGYTDIQVMMFPYIKDMPIEKVDWYGVLAKKSQKKN